MVGAAIKSILSGVGANIYGLEVPRRRGAKWVIYSGISRIPHRTKDGVSTLDRYRFQMDSYTRSEEDLDTLAEAVKTALDNYSGTVESTVINRVVFEDEGDMIEIIEEEEYYRRRQDYTIWINQ